MISSEHAEQKLGGRICVWLSFKKSTVQHFDVLSFPGHQIQRLTVTIQYVSDRDALPIARSVLHVKGQEQ